MGNLADASAHKQGHYRKAVKKWKQHTQAKIDRIKNSNAKPAIKRARINAAKQRAQASKPVKPRTLAELQSEYGWAHALVVSDPGLKRTMLQAVREQWSTAKFNAEIQSTKWYQNHGKQWRLNRTAELSDHGTWKDDLDTKKSDLKKNAMAMGAVLTDNDINNLALAQVRGGYSDSQMQHILASHIQTTAEGGLFGAAGVKEDELRKYAGDMGIQVPDEFIYNAVRNDAADKQSMEAAADHIKQMAKSTYAPWANLIDGGQTVEKLASSYKQSMSNILEIPVEQISLQDPVLRKAITNTTTTGDPNMSPIWQFEKDLRKDPRWKVTKNAQDLAANSGTDILKAWGLMK